ncbi:PRC-barrel domain containing protein [Streptomyces sp. NPDC003042]
MERGIWGYGRDAGYVAGTDLVGYAVEATDGSIGKIDKHTDDVERSYVVVDTGPWIFGRRVVIPAGVISRVDTEAGVVRLSCTRDEVKDSPEFAKDQDEDESTFVKLVGKYYASGRSGTIG